MPNTEGKVFWGIRKAYYAIATIANDGSATFGLPKEVPGAKSLELNPKEEKGSFYADDAEYYDLESNEGYEGNWEMARILDLVKKDLLGYAEDANGILYEDSGAEPVHFALLFESQTDQEPTRYAFYNLKASRATLSRKTKEEKIDPGTETIPVVARKIYVPALDKWIPSSSTTINSDPEVFDDWFESVYVPQAAAPSGGQ